MTSTLCRIFAAASFLLSVGVMAQLKTDSLPDAPSQTQQQTPTEPSSQAQQPATTQPPANPIQSSVQGGVEIFNLLQRKSLMFPDLATTHGPLSSWDKFKLAANNSVAFSTVGGVLIGAGFSQAINSPSGYHQGWEGYGKRVGADMARASSANIFGTFVLGSALHQDPRFYVRKNLSFKESVKYSAVRVFITRSDSGERVVNYSGLIGPLMAEGLANVYYPDENRTAGATLTRYASDLGWRFAGNLLRQYWPSINKKLTEPKSSSTNP